MKLTTGAIVLALATLIILTWSGCCGLGTKPPPTRTNATATANKTRLPFPASFSFPVPSIGCPLGFSEALLQLYNRKRREYRLPLLLFSPNISEIAIEYAQWIHKTGNEYNDDLAAEYGFRYFGNFLKKHLKKPFIKLTTTRAYRMLNTPNFTKVYFTEKHWNESTAIGFGCLTVKEDPGFPSSGIYLVTLIDKPRPKPSPPPTPSTTTRPPPTCPPVKVCPTPPTTPPVPICPTTSPPTTTPIPTTTVPPAPEPFAVSQHFKVPTKHCPVSFANAIIGQFNALRSASGASKLTPSKYLEKAAQSWTVTAKNGMRTTPGIGQLNWRHWWDTPLVEEFTVNARDAFREKWVRNWTTPYYMAESRRLKAAEVKALKEIGVGCSLLRRVDPISERTIVVLHLAVFFRWPVEKRKSLGTTPVPLFIPPYFNFTVPSTECPYGFTTAMIGMFNQDRFRRKWPQLGMTTNLTATANGFAKVLQRTSLVDGRSALPAGHKVQYFERSLGPSKGRSKGHVKVIQQNPKLIYKQLSKYKTGPFTRADAIAARVIGITCLVTEKDKDGPKLIVAAIFGNTKAETEAPSTAMPSTAKLSTTVRPRSTRKSTLIRPTSAAPTKESTAKVTKASRLKPSSVHPTTVKLTRRSTSMHPTTVKSKKRTTKRSTVKVTTAKPSTVKLSTTVRPKPSSTHSTTAKMTTAHTKGDHFKSRKQTTARPITTKGTTSAKSTRSKSKTTIHPTTEPTMTPTKESTVQVTTAETSSAHSTTVKLSTAPTEGEHHRKRRKQTTAKGTTIKASTVQTTTETNLVQTEASTTEATTMQPSTTKRSTTSRPTTRHTKRFQQTTKVTKRKLSTAKATTAKATIVKLTSPKVTSVHPTTAKPKKRTTKRSKAKTTSIEPTTATKVTTAKATTAKLKHRTRKLWNDDEPAIEPSSTSKQATTIKVTTTSKPSPTITMAPTPTSEDAKHRRTTKSPPTTILYNIPKTLRSAGK